MKHTHQIWMIIYTIITFIFGWALYTRIEAANYQPVTPVPASLNEFNFQPRLKEPQLSRYQALLEGGLFFEKSPMVAVPGIKNEFQSRLLVIGLVKGKGSRAIVGLEGDPSQESWIVKPGSEVENETIVGIGDNYIEVSNQSGTGKVFFRE
ncbi:MAG: hypothetical protein GXY86_03520 [Firmicutes bacterium]|nr:hypothetical protein [Bacillota bacterium]